MRHGRQDRIDVVIKPGIDIGCLGRRQFFMLFINMKSYRTQSRQQLLRTGLILHTDHFMGRQGNSPELITRCQTGQIRTCIARMHLIFQGSNTDHIEFVQIGSRNAQEFQPFKQRILFIPRLMQYAFVELQPGKLAIAIVFRFCKRFIRFFELGGGFFGHNEPSSFR